MERIETLEGALEQSRQRELIAAVASKAQDNQEVRKPTHALNFERKTASRAPECGTQRVDSGPAGKRCLAPYIFPNSSTRASTHLNI